MKTTAVLLADTLNNFLVNKAPGINWDNDTASGKWNNKQLIGHLIDSAHINLQRFVRCTYEENFKLIYFQEEWVQAQHYKNTDLQNLLKLWELVNLQIIRVLEHYPSNCTQVKCDTGRDQPSLNTIEFIATDYVAHMQHHLSQIF